jgi:hypothetical protein
LTRLAALRRDRTIAPAPFVVGVGRSGTTLLRLMLDAHPQLTIGAETQFVSELIDRAEAGGSSAELVELVVGSRTWADFGLEPEALRERAGGGEIGAAGVLRAFYGLCAEASGKPRWGDKTPGYVKRMRPIASTLSEARFVHLIRDGRDVALSRLARGMGAEKSIDEIAALWQRRIENARRQAKRLRGRYLELRYEDLVAAPEQPLRRVCELIELDYDATMLSYHEGASERLSQLGDLAPSSGRRERAGSERLASHALAAEPPTAARTGAWRTEMSERDRVAFESVAGPLLRELGYDVPS